MLFAGGKFSGWVSRRRHFSCLHVCLVLIAALFLSACGHGGSLGGDDDQQSQYSASVSNVFLGGGVHATSPNYTVEQQINIDVRGQTMTGRHYEIKSAF